MATIWLCSPIYSKLSQQQQSMTLSLGQSHLKITYFFLFPRELTNLFPKGINEQAGAQMGQAQLKLGLGFTPTNLHH